MRKLLVLLLMPIVMLVSLGAASPAFAQSHARAQVHVQETTVMQADDPPERRITRYQTSWYQVMNRWGNMTMHSRLNWWNPVAAANASSARAFQSALLAGGNGIWQGTSSIALAATSFDPMNSGLGYQVDKIAGLLGTQLKNNQMLFAGLFAFLLGVVIWRALRQPGSRPIGKMVQAAVVFALIITMGATASTSVAATSDPAKYEPSPGTPVWIASLVTSTIDTLAGQFANPVMNNLRQMSDENSTTTSTRGWSCNAISNAIFDVYDQKVKKTDGAASVNSAMNSLWLRSAFPTYANMQFGANNPYATSAACIQLERLTGAAAGSRGDIFSMAMYGNTSNRSEPAELGLVSLTSPVVQDYGDNDMNDMVMMALGACVINTKGEVSGVRAGWAKDRNGDPWITTDHCNQMWDANNVEEAKKVDVFNIADVDTARTKTWSSEVYDYVATVQGTDVGSSFVNSVNGLGYIIGAIIGFLVFVGMAIAIFGAKVFLLLLMAAIFFLAIVTMFRRESVGQQMSKPLQQLMGIAIFAFAATLLLALVCVLTMIFASMGGMVGGPGTTGNILWMAFCPVFAVIALHFLFTKVLHKPSPFTPTGAVAWGTAGGAIGGAVGAGLVNRWQNRASSGARSMGRRALASNKATGWMVGNRSGAPQTRRGAGDAGSRNRQVGLGDDARSQSIRDQEEHLTKEQRQERAAERLAVAEMQSGMSKSELAQMNADAKSAARTDARNERRSARAARNEARHADALGALNVNGLDDAFLTPQAQSAQPDVAAWSDLSRKGKREAKHLLAEGRRAERRETPVGERAKARVAGIAKSSVNAVRNPSVAAARTREVLGSTGGKAALGAAAVGLGVLGAPVAAAVVGGVVAAKTVKHARAARAERRAEQAKAVSNYITARATSQPTPQQTSDTTVPAAQPTIEQNAKLGPRPAQVGSGAPQVNGGRVVPDASVNVSAGEASARPQASAPTQAVRPQVDSNVREARPQASTPTRVDSSVNVSSGETPRAQVVPEVSAPVPQAPSSPVSAPAPQVPQVPVSVPAPQVVAQPQSAPQVPQAQPAPQVPVAPASAPAPRVAPAPAPQTSRASQAQRRTASNVRITPHSNGPDITPGTSQKNDGPTFRTTKGNDE